MAQEASNFSIQRIAQLLRVRKNTKGGATLFLGARSGGLFRSQALYDYLQPFSLRNFDLLDNFEKFAECFHMLSRPGDFSEADVDSILTAALKNISATYIDICIAELIKHGIFDLVITTCIDDMLEQALSYIGQREAYDFSIFMPKQERQTNSWDLQTGLRHNDAIKVWKIFGDITSRSYNLNKRISHVQDHNDVQNILERTKTRDVLVVGFDPVWDREIIPTLFSRSGSPNSLWYVNEHMPEEGTQLYQYLKTCQAHYISGIEGNHEHFFQELHLQMTGSLPVPYQIEHDLRLEVRQMKNEIESLRREIQHLIVLLRGGSNKTEDVDEN